MYECEVIRFTRNVIGVYIYNKNMKIVKDLEINLAHDMIWRRDTKWKRKITPLELMIRAVEVEYRHHRWIVMFDGVLMEYL